VFGRECCGENHSFCDEEARSMFQELKRFYADESGPELVEWAVVTVILILATYVILTSIGEELTRIYNLIWDALKNIG
jgi:Flp pilus assembly pilin Flp